MVSKKSQLAVFVLVAVVLVIVFALSFYFTSVYAKIKLKSQAAEQVSSISASSSVGYYVKNCLDLLASDALLKIGNQGGYIYKSQGGMLETAFPALKYEGNDVTYQILLPNLDKSWPLPYYPCYKDKVSQDPYYCIFKNKLDLFGYYGSNKLPALYKEEAPDKSYVGFGYPSLQEQMEYYINQSLKKCLDFSSLESMSGYKIDESSSIINVLIDENYVTVEANFPVKMSKGENSVTNYLSFDTKIPVRLKKIYNTVGGIISKDNSYLSFHIEADSSGPYSDKRPGVWRIPPHEYIFIEKINSVGSGPTYFDDIVKLTDKESILNGKPYIFQFAVQNRYPALDFWPETPSTNPDYDLIVTEGDTITINPVANDPDDEDNITITFEGWQETYNESFRFEDCKNNIDDCRKDPSKYVSRNTKVQPKMWSRYRNFTTTNHNITLRNDLGPHIVIIKATDPAGYTDSQIVRILVDDIPTINASVSNFYDDIKINQECLDKYYKEGVSCSSLSECNQNPLSDATVGVHTDCCLNPATDPCNGIDGKTSKMNCCGSEINNASSIEDLYVLNASKSFDIFFNGFLRFFWRDVTTDKLISDQNETILKTKTLKDDQGKYFTDQRQMMNALNTLISRPDLLNEDFFKEDDLWGDIKTPNGGYVHQLRLTVDAGPETVAAIKEDPNLTVEIYQCLPHRNKDDEIAPFNTEDPFQANHTCCKDDYTYADANTICHVAVDYSCDSNTLVKATGTQESHLNGAAGTEEIIEITGKAITYCDGKRGNYCNGEEATIVPFDCSEFNHYRDINFIFKQNQIYSPKGAGYHPVIDKSTRKCSGTCFNGVPVPRDPMTNPPLEGLCKGYEFSCSTDDLLSGNAKCEYSLIDIDRSQEWCSDCASQGTEWLRSPDHSEGTCCGDDENEFIKTCKGAVSCDDREICCPSSLDCAYVDTSGNFKCYKNNEKLVGFDNIWCRSGQWKSDSAKCISNGQLLNKGTIIQHTHEPTRLQCTDDGWVLGCSSFGLTTCNGANPPGFTPTEEGKNEYKCTTTTCSCTNPRQCTRTTTTNVWKCEQTVGKIETSWFFPNPQRVTSYPEHC